MSAMVYENGAYKEAETPKAWNGSAFVDTDGKHYNGSAWVEDWSAIPKGSIYYYGNERVAITGGWTSTGYSFNDIAAKPFMKGSDYLMPYSDEVYGWPIIGTVNKVNLAPYNTMKWVVKAVNSDIPAQNSRLTISTTKSGDIVDSLSFDALTKGVVTTWSKSIASLNQSYYISILASGASNKNLAIYEVVFE